MKPVSPRTALVAACALLSLAGCSQQASAPASAPSPSQASVDAARNLDTYRQLVRIHNDEMASSLGKDIVNRYPDSAAAKEVQQTLPAIEQRYTRDSEKSRLERLWVYQLSPMEGGTQSTASIGSSGSDRVQLVLRRHTSWGQNAFLYGTRPGFVCRHTCSLGVIADGKPAHVSAFAPTTGEPALMISDDKAFIALLQRSKKISMDVTLAHGEKKETLVYEVGGFDPAKWASLPKGTQSRKK